MVTAEEAAHAADRLQQYVAKRKQCTTNPAAIAKPNNDAAVRAAGAPPARRVSLTDLKAAAAARRQMVTRANDEGEHLRTNN
jgi:hypothetical protein